MNLNLDLNSSNILLTIATLRIDGKQDFNEESNGCKSKISLFDVFKAKMYLTAV